MAKRDAKIVSSNDRGEYLVEVQGKRNVIKKDKLHEYVRKGEIRLTNIPMYTCVGKVRNANNVIVGYKIKKAGKSQKVDYVPAKNVKSSINEFKAQFNNLTLTSDNRLVDKAIETDSRAETNKRDFKREDIKAVRDQSNIDDKNWKDSLEIELTRKDITHIFLITQKLAQSYSVTDIKLMISGKTVSTVGSPFNNINKYKFAWNLCDKQTLNIIVCPSNERAHLQMPMDCRRLFSFSKDEQDKIDIGLANIKVLVLSEVDWSKTVNADEMFYCLNAEKLMIKKSKADNLINMYGFCKCQTINGVNFDDFDVPNLHRATAMFKGCKKLRLEGVRLKGISLSNAKFVGEMFRTDKFDLQSDSVRNDSQMQKINTDLSGYNSEMRAKAVEAIIQNYGDKFIEFFKYAYKSCLQIQDGCDDYKLSNVENYQGDVIIHIANELCKVIKKSDLFTENNSSVNNIVYIAIAYCLGWTGYNKEGLNQSIDCYIYNTDVCSSFVTSTYVKEAQRQLTVEEASRQAKLGEPNRKLVRVKIKNKSKLEVKADPWHDFGTPAYYDFQILKAIEEIYGIDLSEIIQDIDNGQVYKQYDEDYDEDIGEIDPNDPLVKAFLENYRFF